MADTPSRTSPAMSNAPLSQASELIIDQQADGSADIVQMAYDSNTRNIDEMFPMNSLLDFYSETLEAPIARIENSSSVATIVDNGMPASKKELVAIGGSGFKYAPFMLKGPVPEAGDIDEDNRLFHPYESKSRVALRMFPTSRPLTTLLRLLRCITTP